MQTITSQISGLPAQMISAYFDQTDQYYSSSKGAFVKVSEMHRTYAGNAAARYIHEAAHWVAEVEGDAEAFRRPAVWMIRRPLFLALVARANAA
jgi:hypothetical protein